jgi:hypothetical protein
MEPVLQNEALPKFKQYRTEAEVGESDFISCKMLDRLRLVAHIEDNIGELI